MIICSNCSIFCFIVCNCIWSVDCDCIKRAWINNSFTCFRLSATRVRISFFKISRLAWRVNPSNRWFNSLLRKCSNHWINRINLCSKSWYSERRRVRLSTNVVRTRSASVHWISSKLNDEKWMKKRKFFIIQIYFNFCINWRVSSECKSGDI